MVEFITGGSGSGKTTLMFDRIKKNSAGGKKQLVLVPEQYSYEFDKTLYSFLGAENFNRILSLTFTGFARQIFQIYGDCFRRGEFAGQLESVILIHQAIETVRKNPDSLRCFRKQSVRNGFAEDVLKLIKDLKRSGTAPVELMQKSDQMDRKLADKTRDIAEIYLEYERLMNEYGFKDHLENVRIASKIAVENRYFDGFDVYIDEFDSFTGDQIDMLRAIIESADNVVITLKTEDVHAGEFTLFETVNRTFRSISSICSDCQTKFKVTKCEKIRRFKYSDLEYLSKHIMRNFRYKPETAPEPENIKIFEARDMYSETEYVCASIKRMIYADETLHYRDIAILVSDVSPYADVLKSAFARYEIPYFLSSEKPVTHTSVMVFFSSLLEILSSTRIRSEQIFRFLKCGVIGVSVTEVSLLENYCYKWSVEGEMWLSPFTAEDENLEMLEKIRLETVMPVMELKNKLGESKTAIEICTLIYNYLCDCSAEQNIALLMESLIRQNRDYYASELKKLWACLMDILDSIAQTLDCKDVTFAEISSIMKSMMGTVTYSVPPQTLDSVIVASARTARLNAPRVVFVMGCTDGDFPNRVQLYGLFSETDKQKLYENDIEVSRPLSDLIASERLIVYKSLSSGSEKLFVTYPLSDLSGQAKYPAQVIDQIFKMFGSTDMRTTEGQLEPDFYAVTLHSAFYHYMQNFRMNSSSVSSIRKILLEKPEYSKRVEAVLKKTNFAQEYHIDRYVMQKLKKFSPLSISPTAFENYNKCHFMYFCNSCLGLRVREKVKPDSRIAGDLTHDCLHHILENHTKDEFINMSPEQIRREIISCADIYKSKNLGGNFGKTPKFGLIFNKLIDSILSVVLHTQKSLTVTDFVPDKFEHDLTKSTPVVLPFADGNTLNFGGIIDRADVCTIDGRKYVRIIDYKSNKKFINKITLASGINMQMLLYLFAVTEKNGLFGDCLPAGVLYLPVQYSDVSTEDIKDTTKSMEDISLKATGLLLSDKEVLRAMGADSEGKFIPAQFSRDGSISGKSSCISSEGMDRLKDFTYNKIITMADSLWEGNAEAVPMVNGNDSPCNYCQYGHICNNADTGAKRSPDENEIQEAEEILNMKGSSEEDKTERGDGNQK